MMQIKDQTRISAQKAKRTRAKRYFDHFVTIFRSSLAKAGALIPFYALQRRRLAIASI